MCTRARLGGPRALRTQNRARRAQRKTNSKLSRGNAGEQLRVSLARHIIKRAVRCP